MVERKEIETGTEDLLAYIEDGVAVLTMNRPGALNAITTEMLDLLESHLDAIEIDDSRAVILTGAGRAFVLARMLKAHPRM